MRLAERERRLLLGLGAILALALLVRLFSGGDDGGVGPTTAGSRTAARRGGEPVREVVELNLAALQPHSGEYKVERDPFRYGAVPTPPPPPTPPPRPTPPPQVVEVAPAGPPPPPPAPPPPSIDHLKFLGTFGPARSRIAVIVSGDEIFNVREGAVLEGKFIVQEIGYESVAIAFVGFPDAPPRRLAVGG